MHVVCYSASAIGFAFCRSVLGLDGTHLKSKFQGILLCATGVNANGSLFPLAYAVVDAENDDNWLWFVKLLHDVVQLHIPAYLELAMLTFISDRQKGLLEAVEHVFPGSSHGYCLRHLYDNMHKKFKHKMLRELLWKAARATTAKAFDEAIAQMRCICSDAVTWLFEHAKPEHWAEFYFRGRRYGHLTSNIAESLNSWLLTAHEKPILAMFEQIRQQLAVWFDAR